MLEFLIWVLAVYGCTTIITQSKLFKNSRDTWHEFMVSRGMDWAADFPTCPMCVGFWAGIAIGISLPLAPNLFLDGCIGSAVCWILHVAFVSLCHGRGLKL